MKKNKSDDSAQKKNSSATRNTSANDNEKSLGSSNAFDATENPQKDKERELSDEELDELLDED